MSAYAELCVTTNFTFLRGASHPEELVTRAAELGLAAIAITDRNSVAGVVRAFSALKELKRLREEESANDEGPVIRSRQVSDPSSRQRLPDPPPPHIAANAHQAPLPRLIPGARLVLIDSPVNWLALPTDIAAWSRLTRLLSLGKRRAPKGQCHLAEADLLDWGQGMILIALPPDLLDADAATQQKTETSVRQISQRIADVCYLGAAPFYDGQDQERFERLAALSQQSGLPMAAVGEVLMHRSARRPLAEDPPLS